MERRLGRGLGSLLTRETHPAPAGNLVDIDQVVPNPVQPREDFEPEALKELEESIRRHGVLQPILVRPSGTGYQIVSGERRWRAARAAGLSSIPVTVRQDVRDDEMLELALVENLQRRDLNPIERAKGFLNLLQSLGLTQEQVASKVGLPRTTVTNHLRLLELSSNVQAALESGLLSMGHAKALLGVRSVEAQDALLQEIVRKGLSVREVEQRVRQEPAAGAISPSSSPRKADPAWVATLESKMRSRLGTKVAIHNLPGRYEGEIVIRYYDRESLDRLVGILVEEQTLV
jgi:ParB family transcriptional regulator, chromosome partitioning protein